MDIDKCMKLLREAQIEMGGLCQLNYNNNKFKLWKDKVSDIIENTFGRNSTEYHRFNPPIASINTGYASEAQLKEKYLEDLEEYELAIRSIIQKYEILGKPSESQTVSESKPPKAFIAHGGNTIFLTKLQNFLSALGVIPLIAEEEPSSDRSVNEQVDWCIDNADCAIILGTADDNDLKDGKLYPRRNVHIEIGRVQERFPGKVIYLLEEGASFPTNINEKLYERFTQTNMEKAFIKIAKELRAFGIIMAKTIRKQIA